MGRNLSIAAIVIAVVSVPVLLICCVAPPEIVIKEFSAAPPSIAQGENATLRWNVSGAAEVNIDNGIGTLPLAGSWEIRPLQRTTYMLTAKNSGRSVQRLLTVEVTPRPVVVEQPQVPVISALDTSALLSSIGQEVIAEGRITYISSWLPSRFSGQGNTFPWTFMFFMKDVLEGSADNPGVGEYCPECWRDYTRFFRAVIRPEYLTSVLPALSKIYGGNFFVTAQGMIVGATAGGNVFFMPSPSWEAGYMITQPVTVRIRGVVVNYLAAPAIYLTSPGQISAAPR